MQVSIGKLATALVALLITVTVITTVVGFHVLQHNFRSLEQRHDAEAHDSVLNAAVAIRNQVRFYQGILQLIAANPEVVNLLEFGEPTDLADWSAAVGRLLPGSLGTALASARGAVFGDPLALRIGTACQAQMQRYTAGSPVAYPLLHTDVAGLEHFDLLARVTSPSGQQSGTLFVSFRLSILTELLEGMTSEGDRFVLLDDTGSARLSVGTTAAGVEHAEYRAKVPDTAWELVLRRPLPPRAALLSDLVIADSAIVVAVSLMMVALVRATHGRFTADMQRIHRALTDVLDGRYRPSRRRPAIKEVGILLSDIEQLALKIQHQSMELRQQSLSDPLTGLFNRRYFDLMLAHMHELSRRQRPGMLVIVDLNDFKRINDGFGHAAGDRVLQSSAEFLRAKARATDIVARLGGDEFALILTEMSADHLEAWLTALVREHAGQTVEHGARTITVCPFSMGAAAIDAAHHASPEDVFAAADAAMYAVKAHRDPHRGRFAIAPSGNVTPISPARGAR